jgi:hypothetical protein
MTLANIAIRSGVGYVVGTAIGKAVSPVASAVKGAGTVISNTNRRISRAAETSALQSETKDVVKRMNLQNQQRAALIDFGNSKIELDDKFNAFDPEMQATLQAWEQKLPDVI